MGIIILLSVIFLVCLTFTIIGYNFWGWDTLWGLGMFVSSLLIAVILGLSIFCIVVETHEETEIFSLQQERESLVESYNTYYTNYDEDLAHSQSLKEIRQEIAEFNSEINKNNHFNNSFWLNWFYIDCQSIELITINNGVAE